MELRFTASFSRDYLELALPVRNTLNKKLAILLTNARHPSLRVKKMEGYVGIWEGRITKGYRFTFQIDGKTYLLRRAGTHNILKHP